MCDDNNKRRAAFMQASICLKICVTAKNIAASLRSLISRSAVDKTHSRTQNKHVEMLVGKDHISICGCTGKIAESQSLDRLSEAFTRDERGSSAVGSTSAASDKSNWGIQANQGLGHDFSLVRVVGHGSFGTVYSAKWVNSTVAAKMMRWDKMSSEGKGNPIKEAELCLQLAHPNVVRTYMSYYNDMVLQGEEEKDNAWKGHETESASQILEAWIIQEWCDLGTLHSFCNMSRCGQQYKDEVGAIFWDIVAAGAYLHSCNVIHGDLTSNNVLLQSDYSQKGFSCKVSDFGLSRILKSESKDIQTTSMGTVTYMPPELFEADTCEVKLTPAADVYSAGVLFWQILMGSVPFAGLSAPQVVLRVATGRRLKLPDTAPDEFLTMFDRCTQMDPDERPQFHNLLESLIEFCPSPPEMK